MPTLSISLARPTIVTIQTINPSILYTVTTKANSKHFFTFTTKTVTKTRSEPTLKPTNNPTETDNKAIGTSLSPTVRPAQKPKNAKSRNGISSKLKVTTAIINSPPSKSTSIRFKPIHTVTVVTASGFDTTLTPFKTTIRFRTTSAWPPPPGSTIILKPAQHFDCRRTYGGKPANIWVHKGCWEWRVVFLGLFILAFVPGILMGMWGARGGLMWMGVIWHWVRAVEHQLLGIGRM